jgi:FAD/FMN-containing dehydrogenase
MWLIFGRKDLNAMWKVKRTFDPRNLCNPGKVLPKMEIEESKTAHA